MITRTITKRGVISITRLILGVTLITKTYADVYRIRKTGSDSDPFSMAVRGCSTKYNGDEFVGLFSDPTKTGSNKNTIFYGIYSAYNHITFELADNHAYRDIKTVPQTDYVYVSSSQKIRFFSINLGAFDQEKTIMFDQNVIGAGSGIFELTKDAKHLVRFTDTNEIQKFDRATMTQASHGPVSQFGLDFSDAKVTPHSGTVVIDSIKVLSEEFIGITFKSNFDGVGTKYNFCVFPSDSPGIAKPVICINKFDELGIKVMTSERRGIVVLGYLFEKKIRIWDYLNDLVRYDKLYGDDIVAMGKASGVDNLVFMVKFFAEDDFYFEQLSTEKDSGEMKRVISSKLYGLETNFEICASPDASIMYMYMRTTANAIQYFLIVPKTTTCPSNCETCESTTNECFSCTSGTFLDSATGSCMASCPPDLAVDLGVCLNDCPSGLNKGAGGVCQHCETFYCSVCSDPSVCDNCESGYDLVGGQCTLNCPNAHYFNAQSNSCLGCLEGCLECSDGATCSNCEGEKEFSNGACSVPVNPNPVDPPEPNEPEPNDQDQPTTEPPEEEGNQNEGGNNQEASSLLVNGCQIGFYLSGSECLQCSNACNECLDSPENCIKTLRFTVMDSKYFEANYEASLKIILLELASNTVVDNFKFKGSNLNPTSFIAKIEGIPDEEFEAELAYDKNLDLKLRLKFRNKIVLSQLNELRFSITGNGDFTNVGPVRYTIYPSTIVKGFIYQKNPLNDQEVLSSKSILDRSSRTISDSLEYSVPSTEILAIIFSIFTLDIAGSIIKFSQLLKLIARFNMIDINYGVILSPFMQNLSDAFDDFQQPTAAKNTQRVLQVEELVGKDEIERGTMSKFTRRRVILKFSAKILLLLKISIYLVSWTFKIFMRVIAIPAIVAKKNLSMLKAFGIKYHRKVHFLCYNLIVIDLAYFGSRTVLHIKTVKETYSIFFVTSLSLLLLVWDTAEIVMTCHHLAWVAEGKDGQTGGSLVIKRSSGDEEGNSGLKRKDDSHGFSLGNKKRRSNKVIPKGNYRRPSIFTKLKSFQKKKLDEKQLEELNLNEKRAEELGYKKHIDLEKSLIKIWVNYTVINFAKEEIKKENRPALLKNFAIAFSNFSFTVRLLVYHILLVSLSRIAVSMIVSFALLECLQLSIIVKNYWKHRYFSRFYIFIWRVLQSSFLIIFHLCCVLIYIENKSGKKDPSIPLQKTTAFSLIILIVLEYLFLVINAIFVAYNFYKTRGFSTEDFIAYYWKKTERNGMQRSKIRVQRPRVKSNLRKSKRFKRPPKRKSVMDVSLESMVPKISEDNALKNKNDKRVKLKVKNGYNMKQLGSRNTLLSFVVGAKVSRRSIATMKKMGKKN